MWGLLNPLGKGPGGGERGGGGGDEDPDPLIFGPPDTVLFSTDPDPTCNNGCIKLFSC